MEDSVFVESTGCHHGQRQHVQLAGLLKPVGVNTQHCLCIVAALPAFHQFQVPVRNSSHVAVDLKKKGFALEQLLRLSAGPAGPPIVDCPAVAKLLVRVLWQVACSPGVRVGVGQLKADPQANSLRFCRPRQKVVQCFWKIRVSIGRDLDKDRWVGWVHRLTTPTRGLRPYARSEPSVSRREHARSLPLLAHTGRPQRQFPRSAPVVLARPARHR